MRFLGAVFYRLFIIFHRQLMFVQLTIGKTEIRIASGPFGGNLDNPFVAFDGLRKSFRPQVHVRQPLQGVQIIGLQSQYFMVLRRRFRLFFPLLISRRQVEVNDRIVGGQSQRFPVIFHFFLPEPFPSVSQAQICPQCGIAGLLTDYLRVPFNGLVVITCPERRSGQGGHGMMSGGRLREDYFVLLNGGRQPVRFFVGLSQLEASQRIVGIQLQRLLVIGNRFFPLSQPAVGQGNIHKSRGIPGAEP